MNTPTWNLLALFSFFKNKEPLKSMWTFPHFIMLWSTPVCSETIISFLINCTFWLLVHSVCVLLMMRLDIRFFFFEKRFDGVLPWLRSCHHLVIQMYNPKIQRPGNFPKVSVNNEFASILTRLVNIDHNALCLEDLSLRKMFVNLLFFLQSCTREFGESGSRRRLFLVTRP